MALGRSESSWNPLTTLFNEGALGSMTDGELLARFLAKSGEPAQAAFAVLVGRHAGMVRLVCRQMLGEEHDAEDASQATFLVLAKKARSIKRPEALGPWLHGVALRVSRKAKVAAARRRAHEWRGGQMAARIPHEAAPADRCPELHEEIDRLPERYRLPIVLCYLEGLTHEAAAQRLGWPLGTVQSRLDRARQRLRDRLTRRGAALGVPLLAPGRWPVEQAVPHGWIEAMARSATEFAVGGGGNAAAGVASAHAAFLARETLRTMTLTRRMIIVAYSLVAVVGATGVLALVQASTPRAPAPEQATAPREARGDPQSHQPLTVNVAGRVLDPDGKPLRGARIWLAFQGNDWTWSTRVPEVRATADRDGRFTFRVSDADAEVSRALRMTSGWPGGFGDIQVLASADGFGPAWTALADLKGDFELRLAADDTPIEGRLLNLEGRPLPGINVRTLQVEDRSSRRTVFGAPSGLFQSAVTDRDGRFKLAGVGRGRIAMLGLDGPGITRSFVAVTTGPAALSWGRGISCYAAKFEHLCKPGRSITGVVRDLDTGKPVPGIRVTSQIGTPISAVTDEQGRYRLDGLEKSPTQCIVASSRGGEQPYCTSERKVDDTAGYAPMVVDLAVAKGVVVTGRLTDRATGRPVQAWVAYTAMRDNPNWSRIPGFQPMIGNKYAPSPHLHVPSMADGSFRLIVLPGKGFLVAHVQYQSDRFLPAGVPNRRMPGAPADALDVQYDTVPFELFPSNFPAVKPIDIAPGTASITCDLTVDSGVVRTGSVLDPEGQPLSGVSMVGETRENFYDFTALDGNRFTVYGLFRDPKLYRTVIFRHPERKLGKTLRVDGSERGPMEVRLEPMASLSGRLVDETKQPRKQAELRLLRIVDDPIVGANGEFSPPLRATTDADGRFLIEGVVPGTAYWLQTSQGKYFNREFWTPRAGERKDLGDITPKAGE